jgi:hypothetical protein
MPDAAAAFAPGDRVLLCDQPLLSPLIVDHVRMFFAGEAETNGPVWCRSEDDPGQFDHQWWPPRRYGQCELVPCPPEYEPAPPSDRPRLALDWLQRNHALLVVLHGVETVTLTERNIRERIRLHERIETALAAEPEAAAIRRAEIAMGAPALGEIFTMDEFVRSERQ